jgi:uncharacterized protein (TIGR02996 family)
MNEQEALIHACREHAANDIPRLVYADWLDEHEDPTNALRLRTAAALRTLLVDPSSVDNPLDALHLKEQYEFQVALLQSLNLLETQNGLHGITAVDGKFHPLPTLEDIQHKMNTSAIREKIPQGFHALTIVPFGLSLIHCFLPAFKEGLLRSERLSDTQLDRNNPLYVWEQYTEEPLVYHPLRFAENHGGSTKEQLLARGESAWQVHLLEGDLLNIPAGGEGVSREGRTPLDYLEHLHFSRGEKGLNPETYLLCFLSTLERTGQLLDTQTLTYLLDTYFPSGHVPSAYWAPVYRRAGMSGSHPGSRDRSYGARVAVRVI